MRYAAGVPLLTALYAMALGSAAVLDLLLGAAVSAAALARVPHTAAAPRSDRARFALWRRSLAFPPFLAAVSADVVVGTWQVAAVILGFRPLRSPGIVRIPIGERSRRGVAVTTLIQTLSPGTVFVAVDWQRQEMLFHVMDARDPDRVRAVMERFYVRWQRPVFP